MNFAQRTTRLDQEKYQEMYQRSITDPEGFWSEQAEELLVWDTKWDTVFTHDVEQGRVRWFDGGTLNVSYNCIDRHVEAGMGARVAYYWEGNEGQRIDITYQQLLEEVSRFANLLKSRGVTKGDRVCIYMPMIPEAVYAMLACARIGAVHTVVFGGFSAEALQSRIHDAACVAVITADYVKRGPKQNPLQANVDAILPDCPTVHTTVVVQIGSEPLVLGDTSVDYRAEIMKQDVVCEPESMEAEDPLFILYTSGSTGKPKGVLHTTGGYLLYAAMTHRYTFDYQPDDVYWCAADVGWITGHTYMVYGPLCNGATSVLFEGVPTYPDASRYWEVIDKYSVTTFYSTPTAIRMLMGQGDEFVTKTSRQSLQILGTVGEPINPEAWHWYHDVVGRGQCYIVDTWWQTETGGHALTPIPGTVDPKPGAAMQPFFGIQPVIVDADGNELTGECEGILLLKGSWPGQMRDLFNDHERYLEVYFSQYPGYYLPGDGVRRDADGHLWISGRIDDVMNISGRLIGTAEVESALVLHPDIVEAAAVTIPHPVKGCSMCVFVCPTASATITEETYVELGDLVKKQVGSFARPDQIVAVAALPKTRSGKIMRRIVRKIANKEYDALGDVSTLMNPESVTDLIEIVKKL
ncbi:MAG: acetate--CoA ligase [Candidatus Kaiserbacteria bacterium]|nr:acetate--CoA ligase [Candidatus Kaiserbacteria bacterium]MCB9816163.1 acetate--CoA ligase [Candidatus Nomurabacteria bacterium]